MEQEKLNYDLWLKQLKEANIDTCMFMGFHWVFYSYWEFRLKWICYRTVKEI